MTEQQNSLAHFGIKGMKWGVRRFQNEDGTYTTEGKARYNIGETLRRIKFGKDRPASQRIGSLPESEVKNKKPKKLSQMTDQELREKINRMQMEKQYKQLEADANPPKQKQNFGQKHPIMKQVLMDTAVNTMASVVTKQLQTKADELLVDRRMARAKEKGMLDPDKKPFMQWSGGRVSEYMSTEKYKKEQESKVQKRIENARNQERATARKNIESAVKAATKQEKERGEHNAANAARAAKADVVNKVYDALNDYRNSIKDSGGSAKERSTKRSAYDELMKRIGGLRYYG